MYIQTRTSALWRTLASLHAALTIFALVAVSSPLTVIAQETTPPAEEQVQDSDQEEQEEESKEEKKEKEPKEDAEDGSQESDSDEESSEEEKVSEETEEDGGIVGAVLGIFTTKKGDDDKKDEDKKKEKIEICHINPSHSQVLKVDEEGWGGHDGHEGDFIIENEEDEEWCESNKILVIKDIEGGDASPEDFGFTVTETEEGDDSSDSEHYYFPEEGELYVLADDDDDKEYDVVEDFALNYNASYESCTDISFGGEDDDDDYNLQSQGNDDDDDEDEDDDDDDDKKKGKIVTCTITNTYVPPQAQSCEIVSNTVDFVIEKNNNAVLTWVHGAWADLVNGASWIWGDVEVVDPSVDETQTFVKEFVVTGTPDSAILRLAADNGALVKINGTTVLDQLTGLDLGDQNYDDPAASVNILTYVVPGTNTIEVTVTNLAYNTQDPHTNPAGLIYKIEIEGADCDEQEYVPTPPNTATLRAQKIVCADESYLPNWGAGAPDITISTASDFLTSVNAGEGPDVCWLEPDWKFQWVKASEDNSNPGDNLLTEILAPWTSFGPTTGDGSITTNIPAGEKLWVREVLKSGFAPFTGQNTTENVSAEIYCSNDGLNYDNWDYIDPVVAGEDYYCVAFNAPEAGQCEVDAEFILLSSDDDGSDLLTQDESGPASIVSWLHPSWVPQIGEWIWKDTETSEEDAENGAEETFTRTFNIVGTPIGAELEIASDNGVRVLVNDEELFDDQDEHNYEATATYPVPAEMLKNGVNEITFIITNMDHETANDPENNPAGLLYKLTVNENECEVPEPEVPTKALISATKVMCNSEELLPNMAGGADITSTTATDFVSANSENCWLEDGYVFQWAPNGTGDPADNGTTPLEAPWTSFAPTNENGLSTAEVTVADVAGVIQVREVLKEGDQTFTGDNNNVSAEIFCASDVAGYDNWEWISNPSVGQTYHCVAFNANPDAENPGGGGGNDPEGTLVVRKHTVGGNGIFNFYVEEYETIAPTVVLSPDVVVDTGGDGYGEESLVLPVGMYSIYEVVPEGWNLVGGSCGELNVGTVSNPVFTIEEDETTYCDFYNEAVGETSHTTIVSGNTSAGENLLGWMFNRDPRTTSPFVFNTDEASIGTGSLFASPILNDYDSAFGNCKGSGNQAECDKFIGELFLNAPVAEVTSISYDYQIATDGEEDEVQFYMNLYTNFGESLDTKFYDCRYDIVPNNGSVGNFATLSYNLQTGVVTGGTVTNIAKHGSSPHNCPAAPGGMNATTTGATLRAVALSMGDTSGSDTGVSGYFDNVVVVTNDGSGIHTETYDFEPETTVQRFYQNANGNPTPNNNDDDDDGEVAGASDLTCGPLLYEYLGRGYLNPSEEVVKLQEFLNAEVEANLPLTGIFGPLTEAAVRTFQLKYWEDVLEPWFAFPEFGVLDSDDSTGIVYKTTKWKINDIFCADSEILPTLP